MSEQYSILVIDDEPDLLDNIGLALESDGYQVITAKDGLEGLKILKEQSIDLILADIAMPNMNGYQLFERIRAQAEWVAIPFIFLSARSLDSDVRYGKELGVDDYLTKPIRAADLLAAVRGKLRRAQQLSRSITSTQSEDQPDEPILKAGPIRIDLDQYRVWCNDTELKLSGKEFTLLEVLIRQQGAVLSPEELVYHTHDLKINSIEAGSLLRPIILTLRRKIGLPIGDVGSVENVRGIGYRLKEQLTSE